MELEQVDGRWVFTGSVPMELARKMYADRYSAVRAAEAAGYICYANGNVKSGPALVTESMERP